jgi:glucose-6-phosphate 1-dehydrogenase
VHRDDISTTMHRRNHQQISYWRNPVSTRPAEKNTETVDDHVIVLFGATGDLAKRKIIPGLFHLAVAGLLPKRYRIIGSAPKAFAMSTDEFRKYALDSVGQFGTNKPEGKVWKEFEQTISFTIAGPDESHELVKAVADAEKEVGGHVKKLFHLAVPPDAVLAMIQMLGSTGLNRDSRVICEKPFGSDLDSARKLNEVIRANFDESQVFRIDHFLGKESIDNILALRFANGIFEPIWNRDHVRYVQIDVPETLSIEGRGAFFEETGTFRDMVVTHLFQVLGFIAIEPPTSFDAKPLHDEIYKVFDSIRPLDPDRVVRGQYDGYLTEPGVAPDSQMETFVALRAEVENTRWKGVPFYLRTGKCLAQSRQIVTIGFHEPVVRSFLLDQDAQRIRGNEIVIDFADPGSIHTHFLAKLPGAQMRLGPAEMTFRYQDSFQTANDLEAYEHLILQAMLGNQALFTRSDGIERLWEVAAPVLENPPPVEPYAKGSWGPDPVKRVVAPDRWSLPR